MELVLVLTAMFRKMVSVSTAISLFVQSATFRETIASNVLTMQVTLTLSPNSSDAVVIKDFTVMILNAKNALQVALIVTALAHVFHVLPTIIPDLCQVKTAPVRMGILKMETPFVENAILNVLPAREQHQLAKLVTLQATS